MVSVHWSHPQLVSVDMPLVILPDPHLLKPVGYGPLHVPQWQDSAVPSNHFATQLKMLFIISASFCLSVICLFMMIQAVAITRLDQCSTLDLEFPGMATWKLQHLHHTVDYLLYSTDGKMKCMPVVQSGGVLAVAAICRCIWASFNLAIVDNSSTEAAAFEGQTRPAARIHGQGSLPADAACTDLCAAASSLLLLPKLARMKLVQGCYLMLQSHFLIVAWI